MRLIAEGSYDDRLKIEWHETAEFPGDMTKVGKEWCEQTSERARARVRAISASARGKSRKHAAGCRRAPRATVRSLARSVRNDRAQ